MDERMTYIEIALVFEDDGNLKIEKVYAIPKDKYYQIKGVPAFASNVAFDDIVSIETEDGVNFFDELIEQSGHSVLHIAILTPGNIDFFIQTLTQSGVTINFLHKGRYLVIDVPSEVDYSKLRNYLLAKKSEGVIDLEEACISDYHMESLNIG